MPARRAVIRWAIRLLRREWRQQLLILALITVAVGATVVASTVATNTPAPISGSLGTAQDAASFSGSPASINAQIKSLEQRWGRVDVIENESAQIPGTLNTFELRAQDPHGPFGGPLLSLVSGAYPATASQVAVTSGVASYFNLRIGEQLYRRWHRQESNGHRRRTRRACSTSSPWSFPGQVTNPDSVTVLFDAPGVSATSLSTSSMNVTTAQTVANTNEINPETISIAAAVLGMLLIALVGIGGFTVLAQRRLRAIGMLAAQGATQRHIRLVMQGQRRRHRHRGRHRGRGARLPRLARLPSAGRGQRAPRHGRVPAAVGGHRHLDGPGDHRDLLRRLPAGEDDREGPGRGRARRPAARAEEDPPPGDPGRYLLPCRRVPASRRGRRHAEQR